MGSIDIEISEVSPRDGLQSIAPVMPTAAKKAWISALAAAGLPEIEVGSFVPAKVLPFALQVMVVSNSDHLYIYSREPG